ncbi:sugar ABC transporter substrate-binding protein [Pimelobacter simplex]|uniref:sugar ABC transporter substrate-binding protein n=1 Tax=Nocardioides simplex TaxID=2045 RepID=UPI00366BBD00
MNRPLLLALATSATLAITACSSGTTGSSGSDAPAPEVKAAQIDASGPLAGKTVTYIDGMPGNALMEGIAQGLATELNAQGAKLVDVYQTNAQNQLDLAVANQRIQEAIAQKVDAIVAFPLDANAIRPGVEAAKKAGIPLFIFQDLGGLDVTGKLAFPDQQRGRDTGEALAEIVGGDGEATVLSGIPTDNIEDAVAGAVEGLKAGGLDVVGDPANQRNLKDDAPGAQQIAQGIFAQHPDLDALVVYNSASATGAIAAAKQAGVLDHVKIATMAGEDANIAQLKSGELALSYDFGGTNYGKEMAGLVARALKGEKLANEVVEAPLGEIFTQDNVGDFVPWPERIQYVELPHTY